MAKNRKVLDHRQLNLYDLIQDVAAKQKAIYSPAETPGRLNIDAIIPEMVSEALKSAAGTRYDVAARMSKSLGREISKTKIDRWSAESKKHHRITVSDINAFMEATGDKTILRFICEKAGGYFIEGKDALTLRWGKLQERKKEIQTEERKLKEMLAEPGHLEDKP